MDAHALMMPLGDEYIDGDNNLINYLEIFSHETNKDILLLVFEEKRSKQWSITC